MTKISYILVNEILKDNTTLIYGGGFKPPTKGHLAVVKQSLEKYPQVNKYIIFVGSGTRDGITQDQAVQVWNIYKKYLPVNMEVIPVPSPIKSVFDYSKENPDENIIWVIGGRQGNEDDLKDFVNRTKTIEKYPNITATNIITPISNISGTKARQALKSGDKSEIITYFPSDISDQDIEKIIDITSSSLINEAEEFDRVDYYTSFITNVVPSNFNVFREENRIIVDNILNDTQENVAPNHKGKSSPYGSGYKKLNENTIPSIDVMQKCAELTQHMIEKGFNIKPLPSVKFIGDDVSNAENFLGKTAHYDPNKKTIVVYTYGRHPKDIVRSFSHEMIHHMQNIEDRLGNITTTNTQEDDHLNDIEAEANLKGTMTFRNWTDSLNEKKNKDPFGINQYARELAQGLEENDIEDNGRSSPYGSGYKKIKEYTNKYKKYVLNELFEKDLPIIDKVSKNLYIVSNGNDIEAKYDIRLEIPERDLWSINWFFTPNNKNESTEAWKQVTATSFRVLEDWLKTNNPKALYISGNTGAKTKLYKAYVDKLQTLLNNRYKIDNSDEDRVILRSIEEIKKSSIKKRIETLNESYDQALNYFQNGDINSKSKIERWSSIKHKIERKVIKEMYKITEEQPQNYIIYCDMDGVIADFDKRFTDLSGMSPNQYEQKYGIEQFWNFIDNEIGVRFWVGIPWMQDGKQLWEYIKKYKPTLLSAPSRNNESRLGKRLWVKKHIPGAKLVLASRANKQDYAKPNAILIDDRPDTIIEWENKGGIGILHKSAEETIQKLKSLDL